MAEEKTISRVEEAGDVEYVELSKEHSVEDVMSIVLKQEQRLCNTHKRELPDPQKNIMQWVTITKDEEQNFVFTHQYDADDPEEITQRNVAVIYAFQETRSLIALYLIPKWIRFDPKTIDQVEPRLWVSMLDGSIHVNGQEYDLRPKAMQSLDPQPEYRFLYYRSVRQAYGPEGYPPHLRLYKLGWECEFEGDTIQRLVVFDIVENVVNIRTKR